ncbi:hypothetical protein [Flexivirga sp. B27]
MRTAALTGTCTSRYPSRPEGTLLTRGRPALISSADEDPVGAAVPNGRGVPVKFAADVLEHLLGPVDPVDAPLPFGEAALPPDEPQPASPNVAAHATAATAVRDRVRERPA